MTQLAMPTKSAKVEQYERAAGLAVRLARLPLVNSMPWHVGDYVVELLRFADRLHCYYETACNHDLTSAQDKRVTKLEERVRAICAELGIGVKFNTDPRGFAVKLLLPSGDYNTLGGKEEGWGI